MAQILDGKLVAENIKAKLKEQVKKLKGKNITPGLAVILASDDKASRIYVNNKKKVCKGIGIKSFVYEFENTVKQDEIITLIKKLNKEKNIHGILVQLPLPEHINSAKVLQAIDKNKDVDGFTNYNMGNLIKGENCFVPCTPAGILELLKSYDINLQGKHCVIIGRSNIVGKPLAMLLLNNNATVTVCHSKTQNLAKITCQADVLISAVGKSKFITKEMVKQGAIVIDVGISRDKNNKITGDVDFEDVKNKVAFISPVPGGVGPMTVAMLMQNTIKAALNNEYTPQTQVIDMRS